MDASMFEVLLLTSAWLMWDADMPLTEPRQ